MDGKRPYTAVNPHNPKRRYEAVHTSGPPSKRARNGDAHFQKSYAVKTDVALPERIPDLPPISAEHQEMVFTHPGRTLKGQSSYEGANYDRLEFLGDAYIEIIASKLIFENYPTTNAGGMCHLRESIVKNDTLSKYSILYGFDKKLRIQEIPSDGNKGWTKIYGDVFEAYAAAIVLSDPEHGEQRLKTWLTELWAPVLREVKTQLPAENMRAKEELQKKVMCQGIKLSYVEERKPILHVGQGKETYFIGVYMDGWGWKNQHLGSGEGKSKVIAGQAAAMNALNNHPLIDQIAAKRMAHLAERGRDNDARDEKPTT